MRKKKRKKKKKPHHQNFKQSGLLTKKNKRKSLDKATEVPMKGGERKIC